MTVVKNNKVGNLTLLNIQTYKTPLIYSEFNEVRIDK